MLRSTLRVALVVVGLSWPTARLHAQSATPLRVAGPSATALGVSLATPDQRRLLLDWPPSELRRAPGNRLIVGAVLGAVAGLVACTAISNAIESEGGFHTCTAKGNLLFGVGGAAVGALVARVTR